MSRLIFAAACAAMACTAAPVLAQDPSPADITPPDYRLRIKTTEVDPSQRRIDFRIVCRETSEPCSGTLRVRTEAEPAYSFGSMEFTARAGQTKSVVFRLSRSRAARLRRLMAEERAHLKAISQVFDRAGNRTRRTLFFTATTPD